MKQPNGECNKANHVARSWTERRRGVSCRLPRSSRRGDISANIGHAPLRDVPCMCTPRCRHDDRLVAEESLT